MPQRAGTWGAELSDDDYACAVAEAGVRRDLADGHIEWEWVEPTDVARDLADRWKQRRKPGMRVWSRTYSVAAWQWLARPSVGIDGLMQSWLVDKAATPERWQWPWQIVDLTRDTRFHGALQASRWRTITLDAVNADERATAGLVILDGPIETAHERLTREQRRLKANIVLVVGAIDPQAAWESSDKPLGWPLLAQFGCSLVIFGTPTDTAAVVHLIEETSVELSHDLPIDRALMIAARRMGIEPPVLHGDPDIAERARMSKRATRLAEELQKYQEVGGPLSHPFGLEATFNPTTFVQKLDWGGEGRGATAYAKLASQQRERDENDANKMPPRYLQASLTKDGATERAEVVSPESTYTVMVKIGEFDAQLLQVINPIREPYAGVDVPVDVIISERNLLEVPLRTTINLPPNGPSTEATFRLETRSGVARLELRVTVLHRNRVLQSGIIRAAIDGKDPLQFEVDAVGRHHLAGLDNRRQFDAAIVANHALDGSAGFVGAVPDGVGYITIDPGQLKLLNDALGQTISNIAVDPPRYRTLKSDGTVEVLRELALRGAAFYRLLVKHNAIGKGLLEAERIQVVAARPNTFLPIELAYSYPPPDVDAPLCENAENALRDGKCTDTCGGLDGSRVCPLGFWALSRVIERHEHRWQTSKLSEGADYRVDGDDRVKYSETTSPDRSKIEAPKGVVFAASDRIDAVEKGTSGELATKLVSTFGAANVKKVSDWKEWIAAVTESKRPNLLVVVPHHKASPQNDGILEIGANSELRALAVRDDHVTGKPSTLPAPIVFLLGCETSAAQVPNESFVSIFRDFDAALVISTISTVLGRDAAPVAAALAQAIVDEHKQGGGFVGEAMLKMRRKMLLEGKAMVLALTAYGDADWVLAPA